MSELAQCKAEIKKLEQLINDWRATCVTEQTIGMEWKERALKAEAELEQSRRLVKVYEYQSDLDDAELDK